LPAGISQKSAWLATGALALALTILGSWTAARRALDSGLILRVETGDGVVQTVRSLDLDPQRAWRLAGARPATAQWTGWLLLEDDGPYDLIVAARGKARVAIGDQPPLEHDGRPRRLSAPASLSAGLHHVVIEQRLDESDPELRVALARAGEAPRRLDTLLMFAEPGAAHTPRVYAAGTIALYAAVLLWVTLLLIVLAHVRTLPAERRARRRRQAAHAAALAVTLYGAALRVHALAAKYEDTAPAWMVRAVPVIRLLHPRGMRWVPPEHPYDGDPFSYLRCAREMRSFYGASIREPVFVLATKLALRATGDRDIAVNLAAGTFSTLLVPATYALGLVAFSPAIGLAAATGIAVERQAIAWGVEGWRDDTFAFFVVLSAIALLRLRERPSWGAAIGGGLIFGLATLTRITSLSFLLPGLVLVILGGADTRRKRAGRVAVAALVLLALVLPFLVSCAWTYGDPLHSINAHTRFYRSRATGEPQAETRWWTLLGEGRGPFAIADTALVGLTSYPFSNKWEHFDYWGAWVGPTLAWLSLAGLALWIGDPRGRLLLVLLASSLLPYAFTWDIPGGSEWRFTLHAYPFYLVAAASAPGLLLATMRRLRSWSPRRTAALALGVAGAAAFVYAGLCGLAYLRAREEIAAGQPTLVSAGLRDAFFFMDGWSRPEVAGHVRVRQGAPTGASVRLPLHAGLPYRITLRLDPEGDAATRIAVLLNEAPIAELTLARDEKRIGSYEVEIPASATHDGANRLTIRPITPATGFRLWLVRVEPIH
jgi:hypothetical protein